MNNLSNTEKEMLESKDICSRFNFDITKDLAEKIGTSRIIFTGMGSSLIFPGKQAKNRALKFNLKNRVEAYFASDLFQYTDFSDTFLFLCSNSGKTKEVVLLFEYAKKHGATCIAVTAVADSILAKSCDRKIILSCGFEKGVAATKSVVEQGLIYDSLIFHLAKNQGKRVDFNTLKDELIKAGEKMIKNIERKIDIKHIKQLASAKHYLFVGLENGVAEELTLKTYEIVRKMALFYPDTHLVHGVEEAINGDVVLLFEPLKFKEYMTDFQKFKEKTKCDFLEIDEKYPNTFNNYCLLAAGWGFLRNVANYLKIDIDHPVRVSKVGNPYN